MNGKEIMGLSKYITDEEEEIRRDERKPQPEHKQAMKQEHLSLRSKPFYINFGYHRKFR
jgi:hypothetical protein